DARLRLAETGLGFRGGDGAQGERLRQRQAEEAGAGAEPLASGDEIPGDHDSPLSSWHDANAASAPSAWRMPAASRASAPPRAIGTPPSTRERSPGPSCRPAKPSISCTTLLRPGRTIAPRPSR